MGVHFAREFAHVAQICGDNSTRYRVRRVVMTIFFVAFASLREIFLIFGCSSVSLRLRGE